MPMSGIKSESQQREVIALSLRQSDSHKTHTVIHIGLHDQKEVRQAPYIAHSRCSFLVNFNDDDCDIFI